MALPALISASEPDKQGAPNSLRMVFAPLGTGEETLQRYKPLTDRLSGELGIPIEPVSFDTADEVFRALKNREFDLVCLNPMPYVEAAAMANLEVVAMEQYWPGKRGYHSIIIKRAKADQEGGGLVLAFVTPHSTSGYLMPLYYFNVILKNPPERYAREIVFAGDHKSVVKGVHQGTYDVGATCDIDFEITLKEESLPAEDFTVIWKSEMIPGSPVCVRPEMDGQLKEKIKVALFKINDSKKTLEELNISGYAEATAEDYSVLFKLKQVTAR